MRQDLSPIAWNSAVELVEALARRSGFEPGSGAGIDAPGCDPDAACQSLGLESEPVQLLGDRIEAQLRSAAPAAIRWPAMQGKRRCWPPIFPHAASTLKRCSSL